ncbi:MAG TPA: sigma-54-dependent Fis family transcriptional regulator [Bacteroidales bacterium]|nr:sigma-54-dependent Fis family transcriptional regulator [Bacteroidales bacterium]
MDKKEGSILIVDDNQSVLSSLELFLKYKFKEVITVSNPNKLHQLISSKEIDIVLLDMNFSAGINTGNEGIFWLNEILKINPETVVVLITAYGDSELAVKAIKSGAFDFIEKPWNNQKLLGTLHAALELRKSKQKVKILERQKDTLKQNRSKETQMIYHSKEMIEIMRTVSKVAKTDANVLILGENGTGKELIAQKIHELSSRKNELFLSVDLTSLSENLFESELFGHMKGSFTDSKEDRVGKFEAANGGTLFLDEIGNLPYVMQAKLLSVLQNNEITRIGSNTPIPIDIRIVTATNKDLNQLVSENLFREDLIYRINTVKITLPPLRERKDDIIPLTNHYLISFSTKYNKPGLKINNQALEKILSYKWPGNIRELKHTIEKAVILSESNTLTINDFVFDNSIKSNTEIDKPISLEEGEKLIIKNALERNNWNISETAKELKIGRQTLYRKIDSYDI